MELDIPPEPPEVWPWLDPTPEPVLLDPENAEEGGEADGRESPTRSDRLKAA